MSARVLVTGSLGYIGSRLVSYLLEKQCQVTAIDTGFFRDCLLSKETPRGQFQYVDMRDFSYSELDHIDTVIHLAGISNDPFGDLMPSQVYDSSTQYSVALAQACKQRGVRYVFASSCSIYGSAFDAITTETSVPNPQTHYSHNKLAIETQVSRMADSTFVPVFLRFATLFGASPRMRFDIVVNMLTAMAFASKKIILNSDGKANRPFVHIDDVCEAFYQAATYQQRGDNPLIVNVGSDSENYRIIDVAQKICDIAGDCSLTSLTNVSSSSDKELFKDRKLQDGVDSRDYRVSFSKIRTVFPDFKTQWTLEKGIHDLFSYYEQLGLTEAMYKDRQYYRLQTMENLYKESRIDSALRWTSP